MYLTRSLFGVFAFLVVASSWATHNRAGEIIVCKLTTNPGDYRYEARIITYTKITAPADRNELDLHWGDGAVETVPRIVLLNGPDDVRHNEYVAIHQYSGPGTFELYMQDENRNAGVLNIPSSISVPFTVKTVLVISPLTGHNCSVRFLNPPIQDACANQRWVHNPAAYDPDGDSLSFEPIVCLGVDGLPIVGYTFPGPNYSIDPATGTIIWDAPSVQGEYNIAFIVREWRFRDGQWRFVGSVIRDMQITVIPICDNVPPVIASVTDTCVVAGTVLAFNVTATDPNQGQTVTLQALGHPFVVPSSPATFITPSPSNPVSGTFNWNTTCGHVRIQPYQVVFNAIDNGVDVQLEDYRTMNITVVAPAPQNPSATRNGSMIELGWDASICSNANGYRIYRRNGVYGFIPDHCETGVPAYTGYTFLASTSGVSSTAYTDNSNLVIGSEYCYMVVATFPDGAVSYASEEFCAILDRQVPVITKVSVGVTDVTAGIDTVQWSNAYDLDTIVRPGPYQFKLYRGDGFTNANQLIHTSPFHPFLAHPDTNFLDVGIDTRNAAHVYRVELLGDNGNDLIGSSTVASSVRIGTVPNDEQLTVEWTLNVPWTNSLYEVFRRIGGNWVSIGTSTTNNYVDTGLVNGQEYCYYVVSTGVYSDTNIVSPLRNWSQEVCGIPQDLTPPCPPTLVINNDCELPLNTLTWNNPNNSCASDTYGYFLYFTDSLSGSFSLIATIANAEDTVYTHSDGSSVAGCYVITAVDTVGNESAFSNGVCGDNCPIYTLPNIFTPNGDQANDLFGPFPYRGVKEIDIKIFNRWGQVVFSATDPDINWNGTLENSGEPVPDGVYYYVCQVFFERLAGVETMVLKGYVHLTGGGASGPAN